MKTRKPSRSRPRAQSTAGAKAQELPRLPAVRAFAAVATIGLAVLVIYGRSMQAPFIFDDRQSIVTNPSIVALWPLLGDARHPGPLRPPKDTPTSGRPLVNASLAMNYYFAGVEPAAYHWFNVAVHICSAVLVWAILRRVLRLDCFQRRFEGAEELLAWLVAIVWALHPLETEAVEYVTQRSELLMALFYLATIYASLRYFGSRSKAGRAAWLTLASLACLAGAISKEVIVTAPAIVLLLERTLVAGSFRQALRHSWPLYAGLALSWLLLLALNLSGPRSESAGFHLGVSALDWWLTQTKVLCLYLKLAVWPWPLVIHYEMPYLDSLTSAWLWLLAGATLGAVAVALVRRRTAAGLLLASALLILSPTFVVPIPPEIAAERRMYLPLVALVTLAIVGGYDLLRRLLRRLATDVPGPQINRRSWAITAVVGAVIAVACGLVSVRRLRAYDDPVILWRDAEVHQPNNASVQNNLATVLLDADKPGEALPHCREAVRLNPFVSAAHVNLGLALSKLGQKDESLEHFARAVRLAPKNLDAQTNLIHTLLELGRTSEALEQIARARELEPDSADVYLKLGVALLQMQRLPEAIEQFRRAVELDPRLIAARYNLAVTLAESGDMPEAISQLQQVLSLQPSYVEAQFHLALAYSRAGRSQEAVAAAEKAVELARAAGNEKLAASIREWLRERGGQVDQR